MGAKNSCEISRLPEGCLSHVIALTSPQDACRCSAVSTFFRSAAYADAAWENFLPSDMDHILSSTVDQRVFASKRDLYFHLCSHGVLIDDGKMSLRLDRSSGAKIYMLSAAREVGITWGETAQYWQRVPNHDSRFSEVKKLILVWWFEIWATFKSRDLTLKTKYGAYFVFKLEDDSSGLDRPIEALLSCGERESRHKVCLQPRDRTARQISRNPVGYPQARDDQWLEVEIGEFYNEGEEDEEVRVEVQEIIGLWAKRGLIFDGIEFRPKI